MQVCARVPHKVVNAKQPKTSPQDHASASGLIPSATRLTCGACYRVLEEQGFWVTAVVGNCMHEKVVETWDLAPVGLTGEVFMLCVVFGLM